MNKNAQFYVLFIILICFFLTFSSMAEATEACGLAKEDQGKFAQIPSSSFIKNKKPMYPEEENQPQQAWTPSKYKSRSYNKQFQRFVTETDILPMQEKAKS